MITSDYKWLAQFLLKDECKMPRWIVFVVDEREQPGP
jgi:hypothetical protein